MAINGKSLYCFPIILSLQINGDLHSDITNGDNWGKKTMAISSIVEITFPKWKLMESMTYN